MADKKIVTVGYEDFKEVIDKKGYYVDKTMLIRDIIKGSGKVNLITRPRRFGKTLNLSMLKYFFDVNEKDNAYIFDGLKISDHNNELNNYRNAYPVISLSMKGGKMNEFHEAIINICREIQLQYKKYSFILESDRLSQSDKEAYQRILSVDSVKDKGEYNQSIAQLSRYLEQYYGKKVIILVDEYDVPLENAYFCGFYDEMTGFIRSLFESALKTNNSLEFAVITGCLRVSKESIFTGLNNFMTNSILDDKYSGYFGFEEWEVKELLDYYNHSEYFNKAKDWYDGYKFGNKEIYNPWSVMNYAVRLETESDKEPYAAWINSSSNSIIKKLVEEADEETREVIEKLMRGGSIKTRLDETVTYAELDTKKENIWNFLFFTGYLKTIKRENIEGKRFYTLAIPNKEIQMCYEDVIISYFDKRKNLIDKNDLYKALLARDPDGFAEIITDLLNESISFFDRGESFYHGLLAGLLGNNKYYRLESNRETGDGRCDIILYQRSKSDNAIIMELKICKDSDTIERKCLEALKQINDKHYSKEAESRGYRNIIKYGIAFDEKACGAICE